MHRRSETGMQEVIQMCSSFDANKSTKGASKLRRDLINGEIANLRDLLPLPSSTRQRLSQLQLMALVCVYVRKANYFQQVFKRHHELGHPYSTPNIGFSKALSGFLIMMTQNGKLLYISDNAAEYLGHSMEDLLIHGDSVYDIIDKADHGTVQAELLRSSNSQNPPGEETRLFLCRMNVSRNARRQMRFGDQKVVLLQGHYLSYLPLCSRNEPVFVATCTPVAMPETRECVVQGATNVFTTIHAMDMKFMHIDRNGEYYLGYTRSELGGISWYQLIHWNYMREAQSKHRLISQSEQEKSCILLLRLQTRSGDWIWVHCVLQVKDGSDNQQQQQSVIVATNQVLSEREAAVMRANSWLYHYYTVQTKLQYGLAYPEATGTQGSTTAAAAAARLAAAAYFPTPQLMNYSSHSHSHQPHAHHLHHHHHHSHHHPHHPHAHHQISPDTSGGYATAMPPPLHSPHNGSYSSSATPGHPYHHHHHQLQHAFEMSAAAAAAAAATATATGTGGGGGGKESPLDFSLAASSVFEFPMTSGYTAGSSYWTHHHHPHSHPHPHSHGYSNSSVSNSGSTAPIRAIEGSPSTSSSTVSSSALSPHTWSLLPSSSHQNSSNHNQSHQQSLHHVNSHTSSPSARVSNLSPNTNNNHHSSRKRLKKEIVSEASSPPPLASNRSTSSNHGFILPNGANGGSGPAGSDCSVATLSTPFPYHSRHRGYYKVFGASQDIEEHTPVKEEASAIMTMACPLTPSPIWEGQTQRVPDLQFYCGERDPGSGGPGLSNGTDLIHCVPTYQPYLPFCSTTNPTATALGTAAMQMQMQMQMMESGSPNKENRLPPTPESDQSENDENRPIKWETL